MVIHLIIRATIHDRITSPTLVPYEATVETQVHAIRYTVDKEGVGNAERRQSGREAVGGVGRGHGQGKRKVAGGNGNRKLGIGVNLVAALQRMEWIGLSWRSIWDKG